MPTREEKRAEAARLCAVAEQLEREAAAEESAAVLAALRGTTWTWDAYAGDTLELKHDATGKRYVGVYHAELRAFEHHHLQLTVHGVGFELEADDGAYRIHLDVYKDGATGAETDTGTPIERTARRVVRLSRALGFHVVLDPKEGEIRELRGQADEMEADVAEARRVLTRSEEEGAE